MGSPSWTVDPQRVWLRRALFQVHLWTGLAIGLYVVVMSATGSAIVFRGELGRALTPLKTVVPAGQRKTDAELGAIAQRLYPRFAVEDVWVSRDPAAAVEIVLTRGGRHRDRIFDPYTGQDLGDRVLHEPRAVEWLANLHDNLLGGSTGRFLNGIGAVCFTVLCLTGAVVWWPGVDRWRRSTVVRFDATWRRMAWDLHSAMGFWLLLLFMMWAISGVYLVFPNPFDAAAEALQAVDRSGRATVAAYTALAELSDLHFGRFASAGVKTLWVVLGLVPVALFVTGLFMWWTRVIRPRRRSVS